MRRRGGRGRSDPQIILPHRMFGPCPDLANTRVQENVGDESQEETDKGCKRGHERVPKRKETETALRLEWSRTRKEASLTPSPRLWSQTDSRCTAVQRHSRVGD